MALEVFVDHGAGDDRCQDATIEKPSRIGFAQGQGIEIHDRDVGPLPGLQ